MARNHRHLLDLDPIDLLQQLVEDAAPKGLREAQFIEALADVAHGRAVADRWYRALVGEPLIDEFVLVVVALLKKEG